MTASTTILKNVFINSHGNFLAPANIYFNQSVLKIERQIDKEYLWKDIDSIQKKDFITNSIGPQVFPSGTKIIDAKYNVIIPGSVDPHVHYNTPGFEFRDTFEHGTTAAAFGGVTSIIDMPCTSIPPVTSVENFEKKLEAVKNRAMVDFAFWGGVCGNDFEDNKDIAKNILELNEAGVSSYKAYLISGMETFKDLNFNQVKWTAEQICKTGKPLGVHAEDKNLVETRRAVFKQNNENNWEHYCNARDTYAEKAAVNDMIAISRSADAKIHIVHLSSKLGLEAIDKAQKEGISITAETCPHYLQFTQDDFTDSKLRNFLKTAPPVKQNEDKTSLWEGLQKGILSFITTDHAGCDPQKEKVSENFWEVYGGIPGVEHRVPFILSEGFLRERINLEQTIKLLSTNAAEYFNLPSKGKIKENYDADFALINLWNEDIIKAEDMHSKGKYTPFNGLKINAKVEMTILRGKVIMNKYGKADENIGCGKFIAVNN